jgi:hypothetical protein
VSGALKFSEQIEQQQDAAEGGFGGEELLQAKIGSAQESVKPPEFGGFGSFVKFGPRSRRRCGNVKTRVLCGFSNSEGGAQTLQSESPLPPSEVISTAKPSTFRHFGETVSLGQQFRGKCGPSKSRLKCESRLIVAQSHKTNVPHPLIWVNRSSLHSLSVSGFLLDFRQGLLVRMLNV